MELFCLKNGRRVREAVEPNFSLFCDVLCIGAGAAGCFAAIAAAEEGASVLLLEQSESLGGMHTAGMVPGYYYGERGGLYEEIDLACERDRPFFVGERASDRKQIALAERLERSGVQLLCRAVPIATFFEGSRAVGVRALCDGGLVDISAKMTVDATSDGYVLRMCDVATRFGRESDGRSAPFTARAATLRQERIGYFAEDSGYIDQYDSARFADAVLSAHARLAPRLSEGELIAIAPRTGVREGLCFEGEETLRHEDVMLGREPARILFYAYSDFDRHGRDLALDGELYQNWWVISNLATVTVRIPVPLGAAVPKGLSGIVSAGRCLSFDAYVQGAVRMNCDMFRMGECIGVAAAMAATGESSLLAIDYAAYLARVRARGCFAGGVSSKFGFHAPNGKLPYRAITFDAWENLPLLESETPGVAIWSCFLARQDAALADRLAEMLTSPVLLTAGNAAIALGIMGDARALPLLRRLVRERDCFYYKDCRRSNQFRGAIALCLLGRLGEAEDAALLWEIVFDGAEFEREIYHTLPPDYLYCKERDRNFVYFDFVTHAAASLVRLTLRLGLDRAALHGALSALLTDGEIIRRVTASPPNSAVHSEIRGVLERLIALTAG